MADDRDGRRVAVVAGVRTPFAKSGTVFRDLTAVALSRHAARELLYRSEVDGREVDEVVFSQVVPSVLTPNVAREVSLLPQLPPSVPAYTAFSPAYASRRAGPITPGRAVHVDPQAYVAHHGDVRNKLSTALGWRDMVGRGSGEAFQLELSGSGAVYVQASEEKL